MNTTVKFLLVNLNDLELKLVTWYYKPLSVDPGTVDRLTLMELSSYSKQISQCVT